MNSNKEEIGIYSSFIKGMPSTALDKIKQELFDMFGDIVEFSSLYSSYNYPGNTDKSSTIQPSTVDKFSAEILENIINFYCKYGFFDHLVDKYNNNLPNSSRLRSIFLVENSSAISSRFSKDKLKVLSSSDIAQYTLFYSNRTAKLLKAIGINELVNMLNVKNTNEDDLLKLFNSTGKKIYNSLITDTDGSFFETDKTTNIDSFTDDIDTNSDNYKVIQKVMNNNNIDISNLDSFRYLMMIYCLCDNLYTVKNHSLVNLARHKSDNLRIYRTTDSEAQVSEYGQNLKRPQSIDRLCIFSEGFSSPITTHIPRKFLDSFLEMYKINIEDINLGSFVSTFTNSSYGMFYKLNNSETQELSSFIPTGDSIPRYQRIVSPTKDDIKSENTPIPEISNPSIR